MLEVLWDSGSRVVKVHLAWQQWNLSNIEAVCGKVLGRLTDRCATLVLL